jgi:hypothetical protein
MTVRRLIPRTFPTADIPNAVVTNGEVFVTSDGAVAHVVKDQATIPITAPTPKRNLAFHRVRFWGTGNLDFFTDLAESTFYVVYQLGTAAPVISSAQAEGDFTTITVALGSVYQEHDLKIWATTNGTTAAPYTLPSAAEFPLTFETDPFPGEVVEVETAPAGTVSFKGALTGPLVLGPDHQNLVIANSSSAITVGLYNTKIIDEAYTPIISAGIGHALTFNCPELESLTLATGTDPAKVDLSSCTKLKHLLAPDAQPAQVDNANGFDLGNTQLDKEAIEAFYSSLSTPLAGGFINFDDPASPGSQTVPPGYATADHSIATGKGYTIYPTPS